uniref:Secreted protein n=1 Tax=Echinococcus granulosus TaxID=6210 RepID=A0A068X334_ECHGR|nr:hypothetical protein EgrG_000730200 [Echinococcus granulosus]
MICTFSHCFSHLSAARGVQINLLQIANDRIKFVLKQKRKCTKLHNLAVGVHKSASIACASSPGAEHF